MAAVNGVMGFAAEHKEVADIEDTHRSKKWTSTDVSLEEYLYWARIQRAAERDEHISGVGHTPLIGGPNDDSPESPKDPEKARQVSDVSSAVYASSIDQYEGLNDDEKARLDGRRAFRAATWGAILFLITTDILGPQAAPYALSQTGWVTGNVLYFVMGALAFYAGILLWRLFLKLDSARYPIRMYADLGERVFGPWIRWIFLFLQSVQLVINVGLLCLTNGQALSQLDKGKLCFSIAVLVWAIFGMGMGQIRTLKNLGIFANFAVWMNILICILTIAGVAKYGPYYEAAASTYGYTAPFGPVETSAFVSLPLYTRVNGVMNMIFAYGGAMIFPEFIAEMRRPMDFWKALIGAETIIFVCYMAYANIVYSLAGQYTLPVANNTIPASPAGAYGLQSACNIINILTAVIAAALYANIGLKVMYIQIVENLFKGPSIISSKGRFLWAPFVFIYWALAYVLVSAIPNVGALAGLIAAVAILNFSYSFPAMLALGFKIQEDAMVGEEYTWGQPLNRRDTWKQWSRWQRGIFHGTTGFSFGGRRISFSSVWLKLWLLVMTLGSFTFSGLGMYGSGLSLKAAFDAGTAAGTSFGCANPAG